MIIRSDVLPGVNFRPDKDWGSPHIRILDAEQKVGECDLFREDFECLEWMEAGEASLRSSAKWRIERAMDCCIGSAQVRYFFGGKSLLVILDSPGGWHFEEAREKQFSNESVWRAIRDVVLGAFGFRKPSSPPPWVAKKAASSSAIGAGGQLFPSA